MSPIKKSIFHCVLFSNIFLLFSVINGEAQSNTNLTSKIKSSSKANGSVLLHTEQGKLKLYATFKKNKVADFYAIDNNGKRIEPEYKEAADVTVFCTACFRIGDKMYCYTFDCADIPAPKITKAT